MITQSTSRTALTLLLVLSLAPSAARADSIPDVRAERMARDLVRAERAARLAAMWKINVHLFAANIALADAMNDSMVTIAPFGEFRVAGAALRGLKVWPATYRAGVLAPDLFPDMYTGGWFIHSDLAATPEKWIADDWMRHVWKRARSWPEPDEKDRVMAFAYGFLTHTAGDMFAHTYVNQKADGAWVTEYKNGVPVPHSTGIKHVVLEGYVGLRTPETDITMDVWPRFVAEVLIKDPAVRPHMKGAKHYQRWLDIYDWLGPQIAKAKSQMNNNVGSDAPYWAKCAANPVPCARKEQMETWRRDIDRGFRALIESSQTLGEKLMEHETNEGVGAMTDWASEWVPKMFGAHVIGEGSAAMKQFMDWIGDPLAPINEAIMAETERFVEREFPYYYNLYKAYQNPSEQMEKVGFPAGTKATVTQDMHVRPGPDSLLTWREFEPLYNTVVLSKLALLDGDGLNELVQRAGVSGQLFAPGEGTNILLSVFRSMTHSYQWVGDTIDSEVADSVVGSKPTDFGICGPEDGTALPERTLCGVRQRDHTAPRTGAAAAAVAVGSVFGGPVEPTGGFALWGHPEAREKIFRVIFKGFGPGPGTLPTAELAEIGPAARGVREGARALGAAEEQIDRMREIVSVMQDKIAGVVTPGAPSPAPAGPSLPANVRLPGRLPGGRAGAAPPPAKPAPAAAAGVAQGEVITNWGTRCCSKDIAELRAALVSLQASSAKLQNAAVLTTLGRRGASQLGTSGAALGAAIDAFANTRDASSAAAALAKISAALEVVAKLVT